MKYDPTTLEVMAYTATKVAEWIGYAIIVVAIAGLWVGTP